MESELSLCEKSGYLTHYSFYAGNFFDEDCNLSASNTSTDQVFDLASLTKPLVTTPLVFWVLEKHFGFSFERKMLGEMEKIKSFLPENLQQKTVLDLLSHHSELRPWSNLWTECEQKNCTGKSRFIGSLSNYSNSAFSRKFVYSDLGFILLGMIIEKYTELPLDQAFYRFNRSVLKNPKYFPKFGPDLLNSKSIVKTSFCKVRQRNLIGEVHDENCFAFGGVSGHAGIFGSVNEVRVYLAKLFNSMLGQRLLAKQVYYSNLGFIDGLCGFRKGIGSAKEFLSGKAIGHLGFTGTSIWIDPNQLNYHLLFTNRVISSRISSKITELRRLSANASQEFFTKFNKG